MTVVFSSSSPVASVAVFDVDGGLLGSEARESRNMASGALMAMLDGLVESLDAVDLFVADVGPGSFTGVRVGVTVAKSLGFAISVPVAGVTSFDLVSRESLVVVPSRKGEWFQRVPGQEPCIVRGLPEAATGYGPGLAEQVYPLAERYSPSLLTQRASPESLVPLYVAEPSISRPKNPTIMGGHGG